MNIDTTDAETSEDESNDEVDENAEDSEDVEVEDDGESSEEGTESDEEAASDKEEKPNKEESLKLRKEAIRRKRLEARQLRESNSNCTGTEEDEDGEELEEGIFGIKSKSDKEKEYKHIIQEVFKSPINRVATDVINLVQDIVGKLASDDTSVRQKQVSIQRNLITSLINDAKKSPTSLLDSLSRLIGKYGLYGTYNDDIKSFKDKFRELQKVADSKGKKNLGEKVKEYAFKKLGELMLPQLERLEKSLKESVSLPEEEVTNESGNVETAKANIRKRVSNAEECVQKSIKKESLMQLDTKSLNKLMTEFVRENYKNIDKITITKAMLENRMLKLEGIITNTAGETEKMSITNRGFCASKLEGKRFIMDFKDTSNTFSVIKESIKKPFVFTCSLKEGVLKFEELTYSYKTMCESAVAEVSGKCVLNEGLFNGKVKDFVRNQMNKMTAPNIQPKLSNDGLGFVIDTKEKDMLEKLLKDNGYTGDNGVYKLEKDKQKMIATFRQSNGINSDSPEYHVEFSARKKDVK